RAGHSLIEFHSIPDSRFQIPDSDSDSECQIPRVISVLDPSGGLSGIKAGWTSLRGEAHPKGSVPAGPSIRVWAATARWSGPELLESGPGARWPGRPARARPRPDPGPRSPGAGGAWGWLPAAGRR